MNYKSALTYLDNLAIFGIHLELSNINRLLSFLDNPHQSMQYIHIGGTNGKGSTAAFTSSILNEAGISVGLYTSPHLLSFEERIRINGECISHKDMATGISLIKQHIENEWNANESLPTYFEVATALALWYFAKERVELCVLEVGLGGRLDATNIISPLVSIITNVSLEHTEYLGSTIEEITYEKAGIIKEGVPVICADKEPGTLKILEAICTQRQAKLYLVDKEINYREIDDKKFAINGILGNFYTDMEVRLKGKYQWRNAVTSVGAIELLSQYGINISENHIRKGLANTRWPARLEVIKDDPLIIIDCTHTPAGAKILAEEIKNIFSSYQPILVVGILKDKDVGEILSALFQTNPHLVILTQPNTNRACPVEILNEYVSKYTDRIKVCSKLEDALKIAGEEVTPTNLICVTGSLYTAAEAMRYYQ